MSKYPKTPKGSQSKYKRRLDMAIFPPRDQSLRDYVAEEMKRQDEYTRLEKHMLSQIAEHMLSGPKQMAPEENSKARVAVANYIIKSDDNIDWDSVVGLDKAKDALTEAIELSTKHRELFEFYSMRPERGVVLHGPAGCGKTFLAKAALASMKRIVGKDTEALLINGGSIQSKYVGETEQLIKAMFTYAREYYAKRGHQLIIFIDEADAILPSRNESYHYEISNVSTFLSEMDGLEKNGAFVILATNRLHAIDEALLRDGRCSRKIKIERPTYEDAHKFIMLGLRQLPRMNFDMSLEEIAREVIDYFFDPRHVLDTATLQYSDGSFQQHNFTLAHTVNGAMLASITERAKHFAFRRDRASGDFSGISLNDLRAAIDQIVEDNKSSNHDTAKREFLEILQKVHNATVRKGLN